MSGKILAGVFWVVAGALLAHAIYTGGWALLVPGASGLALVLFALDLFRHRELVEPDWGLLRTLLHVLSAVVVASTGMYWLAVLVFTRGG